MKLSPNETGAVEFKLPKDDAAKAVTFRVITAYEGPSESSSENIISYGYVDSDDVEVVSADDIDDLDTASTGSSSSTDWDSVLDSYDRYVTKYVAVAKKVHNGDMSAMGELAELMSEAESLGNKLDNASNDMTATQMARYVKITQKMATAMQ
ncbi:MAG: hypothetical protein K2H98_02630 [Duncaniella sp.]|nr:hypothetical protein [Duncaniella sp.]